MSLKWIHVLFICLSIVLSFFFGIWIFQEYGASAGLGYLVTAITAFLIGAGLIIYLVYFLKKSKTY